MWGVGTLQWIENTAQFILRAAADAESLAGISPAGSPTGRVAAVKQDLSDRHCGGKSSMRVTFESGLEAIYKPRNLDTEAAYYRLLEWFAANGCPYEFLRFRGVYRASYGWCEIVPRREIRESGGAERYYERAGALLGLAYMLEGSDFHHENLVACGEYPAIVDLESFLQGRAQVFTEEEEENASSLATRAFYHDSVFRTFLLPRMGDRVKGWDPSGLGRPSKDRPMSVRRWFEHTNSDDMRIVETSQPLEPSPNSVTLADGSRVDPAQYVGSIATGFERMFHYLVRMKGELLEGPLQEFFALPVRYIFRDTSTYGKLLDGMLQPRVLRDGAEASIHLDLLTRALVLRESRHPAWPVYRAEIDALWAGDIPYFQSLPEGDAIFFGHIRCGETEGAGRMDGFFEGPSAGLVRRRLASADDDELRRQLSYIYSSYPRIAVEAGGETTAVANDPGPRALSASTYLIDEALRIAREISTHAIVSSNGTATWISSVFHVTSGNLQLEPMGPRLYDGVGGVAVFLASIEAVSGDRSYRDLAMAAVRTITTHLEDELAPRFIKRDGLGGGLGVGSMIYALSRCGVLLGNDDLLAAAQRAAGLVERASIAADTKFDVMGGSAGLILALAALPGGPTAHAGWIASAAEHLLRREGDVSAASPTALRELQRL
jgi:type 2 lantibiotic biosynthesis protein LanM